MSGIPIDQVPMKIHESSVNSWCLSEWKFASEHRVAIEAVMYECSICAVLVKFTSALPRCDARTLRMRSR